MTLKEILSYMGVMMPQMMEGVKVTLSVFALTLVLSVPLGIIVALCRLSKSKILNKITGFYILVMRGTPLLLQIIFIFFGLPILHLEIGDIVLIDQIRIDRMPAAILAFTLNYGAYFAEIFRAGIASIDEGQYEGAEVLGLSKMDTFFRIILPQAVKRVVPPISNETINLVKDTALVYAVGFDDLLKIGKTATNRDANLMPLVLVAVIYLVLIFILSKILGYAEKRLDYYK